MVLKDSQSMTTDKSNKLASDLLNLYEEFCRTPFPYADSRKLLREETVQYEGLIPDLDMYFYNIASHCGGVKRIFKWPKSQALKAMENLSCSFFEKHPQYKALQAMITLTNTPDLFAKFELYERARALLLELLVNIQKDQQ